MVDILWFHQAAVLLSVSLLSVSPSLPLLEAPILSPKVVFFLEINDHKQREPIQPPDHRQHGFLSIAEDSGDRHHLALDLSIEQIRLPNEIMLGRII